ncbi:MAG: T9SS type A sorting domain-containing protein [Candidatus Marinimicrobia bacterium]|nr:T9SS type A sorting domain-containing protein [Candidatus Neomarinimicrobiota bacterium]
MDKVVHKGDGSGDMWESSSDRMLNIPSDHSYLDFDSDGYYEVPTDTVFYANVGWDDVIQQDVTVYFQVNIESAVLALRAGEVLLDSQTAADTISSVDDIAAVYVNGLLGSWWDWGSNPAAYLMTDGGLNGDAVAGDGIYTVGYTFTIGQAKSQTYKYGINSLDNEAGFAKNRTMMIDDAAATYYPEADCFGSQNTDERLPFPEYGCPGVAIDGELSALPTRFALHQNFPNPFNPTTQISFEMPMMGNVKLDIYNILGQKVRTLVSRELNAGFHVYEWNALNDAGQGLSAGVYIYQLTAGDFVQQKKMLLLK